MLTVIYREPGQKDHKYITAHSISWLNTPCGFVLYDSEGRIISTMKPFYLHVKAVLNIGGDGKEVFNGK